MEDKVRSLVFLLRIGRGSITIAKMATKTKAGTERRGADGSCFKEVEVLLTLALPPSGLRDINAAVCNRLNQSLMKYAPMI